MDRPGREGGPAGAGREELGHGAFGIGSADRRAQRGLGDRSPGPVAGQGRGGQCRSAGGNGGARARDRRSGGDTTEAFEVPIRSLKQEFSVA
jgi:hypothetical protein